MKVLALILLALTALSCVQSESEFVSVNKRLRGSCALDEITSVGNRFLCSVDLDLSKFNGGFVVFATSDNMINLPPAYNGPTGGTDVGSLGNAIRITLEGLGQPYIDEIENDSHLLPTYPDLSTTDISIEEQCSSSGFSDWSSSVPLRIGSSCYFMFDDLSFSQNIQYVNLLQITLADEYVGSSAKINVGGLDSDGNFWYSNLSFNISSNSKINGKINTINFDDINFDLNGDGVVGTQDLTSFLTALSTNDPVADFDGNGIVDNFDRLLLLFNYGQ